MCTDRSECVFGKCKCRRGFELQFFGNISKCGEPKKVLFLLKTSKTTVLKDKDFFCGFVGLEAWGSNLLSCGQVLC